MLGPSRTGGDFLTFANVQNVVVFPPVHCANSLVIEPQHWYHPCDGEHLPFVCTRMISKPINSSVHALMASSHVHAAESCKDETSRRVERSVVKRLGEFVFAMGRRRDSPMSQHGFFRGSPPQGPRSKDGLQLL